MEAPSPPPKTVTSHVDMEIRVLFTEGGHPFENSTVLVNLTNSRITFKVYTVDDVPEKLVTFCLHITLQQ